MKTWEQTYLANCDDFRAMARQALVDLDAGETLEMTIVDGKVTAQREKFDYAQWRQPLFAELSGEEISRQAMELQRRNQIPSEVSQGEAG